MPSERSPTAWLPLVACLVSVVLAGCIAGPAAPSSPTDSPTASPTPTGSPTAPSSPTDSPPASPTTRQTPSSTASPTAVPTATPTPLPNRVVDLPDGPKTLPERPDRLTAETVGQYAQTVEYRYAYNGLYYSQYSNVTLSCWTESTNQTAVGWEVVVSCRGYSNTRPPTESTASAVHADWFTQTFRYYVDEDSTIRGDRVGTR